MPGRGTVSLRVGHWKGHAPSADGERHHYGKDRYPRRAPRPDRVITSAGLLTCGSSLDRAFPHLLAQWHVPVSLAAYSCGGSCGIDPKDGSHRIPFSPAPEGPGPKQPCDTRRARFVQAKISRAGGGDPRAPCPNPNGSVNGRGQGDQSIALKLNSPPSLMPDGQRAVTVLVRV